MANLCVTVPCCMDADSDTYGVGSRTVQYRRNMEQHRLRMFVSPGTTNRSNLSSVLCHKPFMSRISACSRASHLVNKIESTHKQGITSTGAANERGVGGSVSQCPFPCTALPGPWVMIWITRPPNPLSDNKPHSPTISAFPSHSPVATLKMVAWQNSLLR